MVFFKHAPAAEPTGARQHPFLSAVLQNHDQSDWAITPDGLICAPVGFYRVMEVYEKIPFDEQQEKRNTVVYGFRPEDLELEESPDDPNFKILKKSAYILPRDQSDYVSGWAEIAMRTHQGKWLDFALNFSNLYLTSDKNGDNYLSNNIAAYRVFPSKDKDGKTVGYNVSYRINPYSRHYGSGLDQDKSETFKDRWLLQGIVLKRNIPTTLPYTPAH